MLTVHPVTLSKGSFTNSQATAVLSVLKFTLTKVFVPTKTVSVQ